MPLSLLWVLLVVLSDPVSVDGVEPGSACAPASADIGRDVSAADAGFDDAAARCGSHHYVCYCSPNISPHRSLRVFPIQLILSAFQAY